MRAPAGLRVEGGGLRFNVSRRFWFLALLADSVRRLDWTFHAYCLITLKGKSYRLRERGLDAAAQSPSLRDPA